MVNADYETNPLDASAHGAGRCPLCGSEDLEPFYAVGGAPTNCCLILESQDAARSFPQGDIDLAFCRTCGFIHNRAFAPAMTEYSGRYVSTQAWSPTFNAYQRELAERLGDHFGLRGGRLVEIGCGAGEFLHLVAETIDVDALGVDPAATAELAGTTQRSSRVSLLPRYFSKTVAAELSADVLVCKMTLEHIPAVDTFMDLVDRVAANRPGLGLFLQVPDAERILRERAFWDIYYEHCNYFTAASLRRLVESHGFGDVAISFEYGEQYLSLYARHQGNETDVAPAGPSTLVPLVDAFRLDVAGTIAGWAEDIAARKRRGETVVLWGSGSKAVAFLGVLPNDDDITAVVDINPVRQGQYNAGTGHPIIAPQALTELRPACVIIMNANYETEIRESLNALGLAPEVLALR